jgi:hypothetical protein
MRVSGLLDGHHLSQPLPLPAYLLASIDRPASSIKTSIYHQFSPIFTAILRSMCCRYQLSEVLCPISPCFSLLSQDTFFKKLFCGCEMQESFCWYGPSPGSKVHKYPRKSPDLETSRATKRRSHEGFSIYLRSPLFL